MLERSGTVEFKARQPLQRERRTGIRVLCRVSGSGTTEELAELLAREGSILFVRDVEVPDQLPLSMAEGLVWDEPVIEERLASLAADATAQGITAESLVKVTHDATRSLAGAAEASGAGLIVLEPRPGDEIGTPVDPGSIAETAGLPVIEVHARQPGFDPRSLLVPVDTGAHGALALRTASVLAHHSGADLEVLHVVDPGTPAATREKWEQRIDSQLSFLGDHDDATVLVQEHDDVAAAVLERGHEHDVLVLGATRRGWFSRRFGRTVPETVHEQADIDVLVVHAG